jgi:endonuclease YncB( thermonuclease family)/beta-lactam-binding protein with PASTA domain
MIKKILSLTVLILSLTLLAGCVDNTPKAIVLPNLTGMNKTEALNALSGLNIQIIFDDIVDNSRTEGVFHSYQTGFAAGMTVEPQTQITVYFVIHENLNGERLPDLTGLTQSEINAILIDMDLNYTFVEYQTRDFEEGKFAGYAGNYQAGMVVPFFTNITVRIAAPVIATQLIITTYVEGLNNNKAIEIMNRSNETIDLSEYSISIYSNGSEDVSISIPLTGELAPNGILVIAYDQSQSELLAKADVITNDLFFDGNDAIAITFRTGVNVDIIGVIGFSFFYMRNETFVRKAHITQGTNEYSILDWDIYAIDNFSMLGSHPTPYPLLTMIRFDPSHLDLSFDQPGGLVRVAYDYANDGDTSTFYSLDERFEDFLGGRRVRFIGIDTPEMSGTPDAPQPYAVEATQYLRNILENAEVIYLMHDPVSGMTETYGRTLALVWADGLLVNVEMVRMGFSAAVYFDEHQRLVFNGISLNRLFERAEQEARANRRGIWS